MFKKIKTFKSLHSKKNFFLSKKISIHFVAFSCSKMQKNATSKSGSELHPPPMKKMLGWSGFKSQKY